MADDPKFKDLLEHLKKILGAILTDWDNWRRKNKEAGDAENESMPLKDRKSEELYDVVSEEYAFPSGTKGKDKVNRWTDELREDARFNFGSYAECFISENLIRKYIDEKKIKLSAEATAEAKEQRRREQENKTQGNISIGIRRANADINYLDMDYLSNLIDKPKDKIKEASLVRDAKEYKPIRNALMHTALLTDVAKRKLTSVYENIKERIRTILSKFNQTKSGKK